MRSRFELYNVRCEPGKLDIRRWLNPLSTHTNMVFLFQWSVNFNHWNWFTGRQAPRIVKTIPRMNTLKPCRQNKLVEVASHCHRSQFRWMINTRPKIIVNMYNIRQTTEPPNLGFLKPSNMRDPVQLNPCYPRLKTVSRLPVGPRVIRGPWGWVFSALWCSLLFASPRIFETNPTTRRQRRKKKKCCSLVAAIVTVI